MKSKYFVIIRAGVPFRNPNLLDFVAKELYCSEDLICMECDKRYDFSRINNVVFDLFGKCDIYCGKNCFYAYRKRYFK